MKDDDEFDEFAQDEDEQEDELEDEEADDLDVAHRSHGIGG